MDDHVVPLEPRLVAEPWAALEPALEAVRARAREEGLWAPSAPEEHGGLGLDLVALAHLSEALGRSPLGHYAVNTQAPDAGNMELLHLHGTPEQRARWLAPLVAGELRSCFAMTEPDAPGSDPRTLATRAERDGDDWVLTGRKWFTTGADGAALALVMAVTDPEAPARERATVFLVPTDTPGFRLLRNVPVMGHAGGGWHSHGEVLLEGVRVPDAARLGEPGQAFALAQARLGPGRVHHCMRWVGIAQRALEMTCRQAHRREIHAGQALATQQSLQHAVAESAAEVRAARLMVLDVAGRIEAGEAGAWRTDVHLLKFFVAGVLQRVLDRAVQAHGALGVSDDTVLAYFFRHERAARIYDGPDEVHKQAAARRILKEYAS